MCQILRNKENELPGYYCVEKSSYKLILNICNDKYETNIRHID